MITSPPTLHPSSSRPLRSCCSVPPPPYVRLAIRTPRPDESRYWNAFDNRFMKGLFGGAPHDNNYLDVPYMNHSVTLGQSQPGLGVSGIGGIVGGHGAAPLGADTARSLGAHHLVTIPSSSFSSMGEERDDGRLADASSAMRGPVSGGKVTGSSSTAEAPSSAVPATPAPPAAPTSSG